MSGITPEMARAELSRRQSMSANITPEMARAELSRRQNAPHGTLLERAGNTAENLITKPIENFGAAAGQGLANAAIQGSNLFNPGNQTQPFNEPGIDTKSPSGMAGTLAGDVMAFGPASRVIGAGARGVGAAVNHIPKIVEMMKPVMNALSKSPKLATAANIGGNAANAGATAYMLSPDEDRGRNALLGAAGGAGTDIAFGAANKVGNALDKMFRGTKTPEQIAETLKEVGGLPVSYGDVVGSPALQSVNSALKKVPFSGAGKNVDPEALRVANAEANQVDQQINQNLSQGVLAKKQLQGQMTQGSVGNYEAKNELMTQAHNVKSNTTPDKLRSQIDAIDQEKNKYGQMINEAPNYVNKLARNVEDRSNITLAQKRNTENIYQDNKKEASKLYEPINNSKLRLDDLEVKEGNLYHGSNDQINEITKGGAFGGIFATPSKDAALSHGKNLHSLDVPKDKILTQQVIDYKIPLQEKIDVINAISPEFIKKQIKNKNNLNRMHELVFDEMPLNKNDLKLLGENDVGEAGLYVQKLRREASEKLGYKAVEMNDEHGTSYLVSPGSKIKKQEEIKKFSEYKNASYELLAEKENLKNLFGTDSDLGKKLGGELSKAESMIAGTETHGVTMQDAVQRIKNLGRLSASATGQGNRREGMLLGKMQEALSNDVNSMLNASGHGELAGQLLDATSFYKNKVVPFWQNPEIRKTVTDKNYISTGSKLSKALHDPNNASILEQLPQGAKETTLYQLMTGGKGTSEGMSNLSSQEIAKVYSGLPVDTKKAIKSYLPEADKYFEGLGTAHKAHEQLSAAQDYLRGNLAKEEAAIAKQTQRLESKLDKVTDKGSKEAESLNKKIQALDAKHEKIGERLNKQMDKSKANIESVKNPKNAKDEMVSNIAKAAALAGDTTAVFAHSPALAAKLLAIQGSVALGAKGVNALLTSPKVRNYLLNRPKSQVSKSPMMRNAVRNALVASQIGGQ